MDNFIRNSNSIHLFEDVTEDILNLFLKQRQEMKEIWENNPNYWCPIKI